jgi:O-antigen/teichoic acid export membrane protein
MTTKATEMAKVSAKGGFHMLWGLVISTVIQSIGAIFIARLLGAESMGLYAIAVGAPNLIATFRDWGMNSAIIKYSAQYNSENNTSKVKSVFISGLIFEITLGSILAVVAFLLSGVLAQMFQRPNIVVLIQISSLFILSGALSNAAISAFSGLEKMHLMSYWQIIQAVLKSGLTIGLVLIGLGTLGAVIGFSVGIFLASLASVLLLFTLYRSLPKASNEKLEIIKTTKSMLNYGLPLSIGTILTGFVTYFYTYIMAYFVTDNASIGNYSVAQNFVILITFFATPVTTMLFPAFSKLKANQDQDTLRNVFQYSVKYAALIVLPVTVLVMSLAQPAISTIFQDRYVEAPFYLALLSIIYLFTAFGSLSVGSLISGQGYTKFALKTTILTVIIGFPLSIVLVSQLGIVGLIIASLIASIPATLWCLHFIKKNFNVSLDWVSSAKIGFSSAAAGILTYFSVALMPFNSLIQLIFGTVIFTMSFLLVAVATRTISKADLAILTEIAKALGPLRKILNILIGLLAKLIDTLKLEP